jgi:hypothetical protein
MNTADRGEMEPLRVKVPFERLPASIKGAFVLAGADGNPHAARFQWARIERIPEGHSVPIAMEDRLIDVAPARDLFVPFETPTTELVPGWYAVVASVDIDGGRPRSYRGRPFSIPWGRMETRRGSIPVGATVPAREGPVMIDRVELAGDFAVVLWRRGSDGGRLGSQPDIELRADGRGLDPLPIEAAGRRWDSAVGGSGRSVFYPVPREAKTLDLVVAGRRRRPHVVGLSLA